MGGRGARSALFFCPAFSGRNPFLPTRLLCFLAMFPFPPGVAGNLIFQKLSLKIYIYFVPFSSGFISVLLLCSWGLSMFNMSVLRLYFFRHVSWALIPLSSPWMFLGLPVFGYHLVHSSRPQMDIQYVFSVLSLSFLDDNILIHILQISLVGWFPLYSLYFRFHGSLWAWAGC